MKILICGATGFIGRNLTTALREHGHTVIRGVRKPTQPDDLAVDFCQDTSKESWLIKLNHFDAVINAVGVLRDSKQQPMAVLHEQTPLALFAACKEVGIKRIVQVSALGVDQGIETAYFQTRRAPEAYLNDAFNMIPPVVRRSEEVPALQAHHERKTFNPVRPEPVLSVAEGRSFDSDPIKFLILRPSVIYGTDGTSAKMFRLQAKMPVQFLPAGGRQTLQPVHIDDICTAVVNWFANVNATSQTVSCVGLDATDMRGMLDSYRQQLGYQPAWHTSVPSCLMTLTAKLGDYIPTSPLCSDTLTMLNAGNTGDATAFTKLLGREPRSFRTFLTQESSHDHA